MIEQVIINKIQEAQKEKGAIIVAIGGAADLGKTYLANTIIDALNRDKITSNHLTLDSFLMDRALRKKMNISGYDIRAHDMNRIVSTLEDWRQEKVIQFQPYDHKTGRKSDNYLEIQRCNVLLIEGLFALHESILPFLDLTFFIYTSDRQLKEIKLAADLVKRGYSVEYSLALYDKELVLYKKNIEPLKEKADFKLKLKEKWDYEFEA